MHWLMLSILLILYHHITTSPPCVGSTANRPYVDVCRATAAQGALTAPWNSGIVTEATHKVMLITSHDSQVSEKASPTHYNLTEHHCRLLTIGWPSSTNMSNQINVLIWEKSSKGDVCNMFKNDIDIVEAHCCIISKRKSSLSNSRNIDEIQ